MKNNEAMKVHDEMRMSIMEKLARIQGYIAEKENAECVHWGDVGDLNRIDSCLAEIMQAARIK